MNMFWDLVKTTDGEVYVLTNGATANSGKVYKIND